jgi:methyl-accepting chemotaxis protein
VRKKFEVAGDSYVEITLGDPKQPAMRSGTYIKCLQDVELIDAVRKLLDDFREAAVPMLDEFRQILAHVNGISRQLEEKQGVAGRAIGDQDWAKRVDGIVKDMQQTAGQLPVTAGKLQAVMDEVKKVSESLNATASRFPKMTDDAGGVIRSARQVADGLTGQVANVQGVLLQTESTLRETERLIRGLQKNWLVRKYIEVPTTSDLIAPVDLPSGKGGEP